MGLIDLSIIAHASKPSACFTKGCFNLKKNKFFSTSWLLSCQTDLQLAVGQLVLKAAASLVADPAII